MATQEQRREEIRARLVQTARQLFVANGFDKTSTDEILNKAGASKGALYHHFPGKLDLFAAVFQSVSLETIARAGAKRPRNGSPAERFAESCFQWLKAAERDEARAILIDQGPLVLGHARARKIEDAGSLDPMRAAASAIGAASGPSHDVSIRVLNAALGELALMRARDGTPSDAESKRLIRALIDALFVPKA